MKAIHLIQKDPDLMPWPIEKGTAIYESGYWDLTVNRAKALVGGGIYFHKKKANPSFFGGIILGYRIKEDEPWQGRIIFKFKSDIDHKGIKTDRDGWTMEMKFVE